MTMLLRRAILVSILVHLAVLSGRGCKRGSQETRVREEGTGFTLIFAVDRNRGRGSDR